VKVSDAVAATMTPEQRAIVESMRWTPYPGPNPLLSVQREVDFWVNYCKWGRR